MPVRSSAERPELFRKPDDRWEANEVSERCPDVTKLLMDTARQFRETARTSPY